MKFVRTARGYQSLTTDEGTVTGEPSEVSNADADKLEQAGEKHGVRVLVFDTEEEAREGMSPAAALASRTPDLSAGIGVATGTGDPVESPGVTPEGDEPSQAGAHAAPDPGPAPPPPTAGQRAAASTEGI